MDTETKKLVAEIEAFCDKSHIAVSTFGTRAMNDCNFVKRLKAGGSTSLKNASRVRDYMQAEASEGAAA